MDNQAVKATTECEGLLENLELMEDLVMLEEKEYLLKENQETTVIFVFHFFLNI